VTRLPTGRSHAAPAGTPVLDLIGRQPELKSVTIIGQGYVGLPLALHASDNGWKVFGLERSWETVERLADGHSHVDDLSDADVVRMLANGYVPTTDASVIRDADVVVICVPTPLSEDGGPDLGAVESAVREVAANLRPGHTVILESTTYPGTTQKVLLPILEETGLTHGRHFNLAFSPERVDPGNEQWHIGNTPKLVGGLTPQATAAASAFYETFVDHVVRMVGSREAEMAKLLENTYRHVNIALVNEMARFCHEWGIDIWDVIRGAATKPFGFQAFWPGPGVGGHCIPIDPNYLSHQVRKELGYPFRFVELAQEINVTMPEYVVRRAHALLDEHEKPLKGSRVLLLGVTYKADIADERESPSKSIAESLLRRQAVVSYHDPYVPEWVVDGAHLKSEQDVLAAAAEADMVILVQGHRLVDADAVAEASNLFFDTRAASSQADVVKL
jgi:UDP-N-acetyl-D-glucosamine dehydrogenase